MATKYGVPSGSALADWPTEYDDLAPFYDKVEWTLGVAGEVSPGVGTPRHGYPMPSFPLATPAAFLLPQLSSWGTFLDWIGVGLPR